MTTLNDDQQSTVSHYELLAIRTSGALMAIRPAERDRAWMNSDAGGIPKRCLPLLIANQAGWELLNPSGFDVVWDGTDSRDGVQISSHTQSDDSPVLSHFGSGIVTWHVPYLFRTPQGWNILARGPANLPKDGISALEGVIESDWASATFTMNWKLTRPDHKVTFERDEPFAFLVPTRRGDLESFQPRVCEAESAPDAFAKFLRWSHSRTAFNNELEEPSSTAQRQGWQRHYMLGIDIDGVPAPAHQRKLKLKPFAEFPEQPLYYGRL
jgi:hypothetical protein